ncbi:MAG TPA: dihydrofolate reductase [Candidatus Paceibacterota bacterium]|nr:dihydrofolate reductase [Candidatus Paceibacterota bacterium]HMP18942.1 dihydrofolate reductase [Candidatus Paceibacterota bacterium]HMP85610.1 dihydrofolate reductase [Candidatus Paceibacterota bacterium]
MISEFKKPKISMIVAMTSGSRIIGKIGGGIPWHIKEDLKYFKEKTTGHAIIMGRKTWEEFRGRPLPNRIHLIVTREKDYTVPEGHFVCESIEKAIEKAEEIENKKLEENKEIFIIGGAQIYKLGLQYADRIYATIIKISENSDINKSAGAKFPDYISAGFTKKLSSRFSQDDNFQYEFVVLEKE